MISKTTLLGTAVVLALGVSAAYAAGTTTIKFDADGAGATFAPIDVDIFDWAPGNILSLGGDLSGGVAGKTYTSQTLYQATLSSLLFNGNSVTPVGSPALTVVASLPEAITNLVPGVVVSFGLDSSAPSSTNFFEIYADVTANTAASNLAGTGFRDGGNGTTGGLILRAEFTSISGAYVISLPQPAPVLLDQFNGDSYAGQRTISGSGSNVLEAVVKPTWFDPNFFTSGINTFTLNFDTSVITPFTKVDPSEKFSSTKNTTINSNGAAPNVTPNLFTVNGASGKIGEYDFIAQADASTGFTVPEPGSVALLGLGLGAVGWISRRRKTV